MEAAAHEDPVLSWIFSRLSFGKDDGAIAGQRVYDGLALGGTRLVAVSLPELGLLDLTLVRLSGKPGDQKCAISSHFQIAPETTRVSTPSEFLSPAQTSVLSCPQDKSASSTIAVVPGIPPGMMSAALTAGTRFSLDGGKNDGGTVDVVSDVRSCFTPLAQRGKGVQIQNARLEDGSLLIAYTIPDFGMIDLLVLKNMKCGLVLEQRVQFLPDQVRVCGNQSGYQQTYLASNGNDSRHRCQVALLPAIPEGLMQTVVNVGCKMTRRPADRGNMMQPC